MGEVVTTDMFLENQCPTIVLFDSRALHSFMSQTFASKYDQKIIVVENGSYCISSARASISTNQIVRCAHLHKREGVYYRPHSVARVSNRCDLRYEVDEWS